MADLELIGLDEGGEHLLLRGSDGSRFRLSIDEPLRAAVRRDRPQFEQLRANASGSLPPREIQARIRSGMDAQEIADSARISVDSVRRYEGPVLAERDFMASQAQGTRLGREADAPTLGDLVPDRLASRGVEPATLSWDAFRPIDEAWRVRVTYREADAEVSATWSFDPQAKTLAALDDQSKWLSETALPDEPTRRHLSPVRSRVFDIEADPLEPGPRSTRSTRSALSSRSALSAASALSARSAAETDETSRILDELHDRRGVRQDVEDYDDQTRGASGSPDPEGQRGDVFEGFGPQQAFAFEAGEGLEVTRPRRGVSNDDGAEGKVFSFADAPASRRRHSSPTARSSAEPDSGDLDTAGEDSDTDASSATGPSAQGTHADVPPPLERVKPSRKGRPKVPSWDEIVFGAKPE